MHGTWVGINFDIVYRVMMVSYTEEKESKQGSAVQNEEGIVNIVTLVFSNGSLCKYVFQHLPLFTSDLAQFCT